MISGKIYNKALVVCMQTFNRDLQKVELTDSIICMWIHNIVDCCGFF